MSFRRGWVVPKSLKTPLRNMYQDGSYSVLFFLIISEGITELLIYVTVSKFLPKKVCKEISNVSVNFLFKQCVRILESLIN